jgi:hypothetical protein
MSLRVRIIMRGFEYTEISAFEQNTFLQASVVLGTAKS